MPKSFAQLGIPFPLFEAPADEASEYGGLDTCSLCRRRKQPCFVLEIGCAVICECRACGLPNGLDADDRVDSPCRGCKSVVRFPALGDAEIRVCYACLRAGRAAISKGTELGMISWEQAFDGVTHGNPGMSRNDFEMVAQGDGWVGARLPPEVMFELLRTPTYDSIQGEQWQFCCRQPMVYVGKWSRDEFVRRASDGDGRRLFEKIVQDCVPGLWEDELHDETGIYVFRCRACARETAHWDLA